MNESIKRRDLAIRAIVKNPDEYASIGQVEGVTDLIGELKEQIAKEDSVLLDISYKLEQTQRYVEEQERNNLNQKESESSIAISPGAAESQQQPPSPSGMVWLTREQQNSFKILHGELEGLLVALGNSASLQSLESDSDKNQLVRLRNTLEASNPPV